jgi:aminoglycoside phosphotransferase (APT) family kinase protein
MDNKAVEVRAGEELSVGQLNTFLQSHPAWGGGLIKSVQQYPGGFSNLTYLLKTDQEAFVLRRPPKGANIKSAHDMGREYRVLTALKPVFHKVPATHIYEKSGEVIGTPFYIMEKVEGIILRPGNKSLQQLGQQYFNQLSKATCQTMAELHDLDTQQTDLSNFGKPEGYVSRQVSGWIERYYKAETASIQTLNEMAEWLQSNMPKSQYPAFIHNDFKYDNLVLKEGEEPVVSAVLDWEMATLGDAAMDLGTTLAYWSEKNDHPALVQFNITIYPGNYTRQEYLDEYQSLRGITIDQPLFYYIYGLFKVATIAQQIFKRFTLGHTKDPRFGALIHVIKACGDMGVKSLEKQKISHS